MRASWPACKIHRVHPEGDLTVLRVLVAESRTLTVLDRRFPLKLALGRIIGKLPRSGGSVVAVSAVPRKAKDMQQVVFDDGFGLLSHNLSWDSQRIGHAIATAYDSDGLAGMDRLDKNPVASGDTIVNDSKHKSVVVEELAGKLGETGMQRTRRGKIAGVVDELLMNALYHASKGHEDEKSGKSLAKLQWQLEEKRGFRATVTDEFGTYSREEAHRKLVSFLANEMVEITRTQGRGGGVGLYLVFKVSDDYHLYVNPGKKTEISVRVETAGKTDPSQREVLVYFAPFAPKT